MKFDISKDWCEKRAKAEDGRDIGAGKLAIDPILDAVPPGCPPMETENDIRMCEMQERIDRLEAAISDNLSAIKSVDEGEWNEHTGSVLLNEDQAGWISGAARELTAALQPKE